ncbi:hypothetical protein [Georgenia sp. SYP-B2076]|uniref:hypothetical protein n=1 Tax=Georgenia sp. SYP-B2076 TaxID=2495881 RepID=UPI000F8F2FA1|nr:hypothetical protein [Georgenia sp. SYP-B2076]
MRRTRVPPAARLSFGGHIAGLGTAEGTRIVLGHWPRSPFGPFADVMAERADGHRILLAPDARIGAFVSATYRFDEVRTVPVVVDSTGPRWHARAGPLDLVFTVGSRTWLGRLLRCVPGPLAASPAWARAVGPAARVLLPGVSTIGTAGGGRREWYGARDERRVVDARTTWGGTDLGTLTAVTPPPRFGFSSTPSRPSLVTVVSTVELRGTDDDAP